MIETRVKIYQYIIKFIDIISCVLSFVCSLYLTIAQPLSRNQQGLLYVQDSLFFFSMFSVTSLILLHNFYCFIHTHRGNICHLTRLYNNVVCFLSVLLLDCFIFLIWQKVFSFSALHLKFYLFYCVFSLAFYIVLHEISNLAIKRHINHHNKYINILIIGSNSRAYQFYTFLKQNSILGCKVIGFMDDNNFGGYDIPLIANLQEFDRVLRENVIDRGVVFLPIRSSYDKIMSIIDRAENQGIALQIMANVFQPQYGYATPSFMGSFYGILYDSLPFNDWRLTVKRAFDITFALGLLLLTLPIMLITAICIKLEDGGPIFYAQTRIGYRKRTFKMLKFRSMVINAEALQANLESQNEMTGPVFKIKKDPRVTRVGRLIRKFNIDELPQLFNILKGDMSIVGPRPVAVRDYSGFSQDWLRRRFSVRPGLTCYWQCSKDRNSIPFEEWMRLDMAYIDNWNLVEDLKICLKTIRVVLSGTGQ